MRQPRLSPARRCEDKHAYCHTSIEERRECGSETGTDPHPTHWAEDLTVHDEKGNFDEEEGW